ncbi:hypothetical protein P3X46_031403 [Hevea brasiliensis]|uniref:CCHC-type domain-containing protein n=1 Tax=Hevea brasiliensis TaxID=3981 RepID=A0ABQ9KN46_HEVBR|nr:hypothetical protein P3X46_031403 [Hevea brasiliensis]
MDEDNISVDMANLSVEGESDGGGLYVFQFFHEVDMNRVLDMRPWTFNNQLLIIEKVGGYRHPSECAQRIDNDVGEFVSADPNNFTGLWRSYMRVRIRHDVRRPLRRGTRLKQEGDEWFSVTFCFESFSTYCFICGLLGHGERFCPKLVELSEVPL